MNEKKGFTLIELLVVTAIIGILASVVLVSLGTARENARDSRRLGDLKQISLALEFYVDQFDHYPQVELGGSALSRWIDMTYCLVGDVANCPDPANTGDLKLIPAAPKDPLAAGVYDYLPSSDLRGYVIKAVLENMQSAALDSDTDADFSTIYGSIVCNDGSEANPTGNYCLQVF